jgi:hypothetical protein
MMIRPFILFCLTLFIPALLLTQTATPLNRAIGVGKNKQAYIDNMNWVENAKNGKIINYAEVADDNILTCLKLQETRGNWHAIESLFDRKTQKWLTEGKTISELIQMIDALTDIKDRTARPIDGVVWNNDGTATINETIYTKEQLGVYRAAGSYQFMPETAVKYGLNIDHTKGIDERFDEEKANDAARKYINELLERYKGNLDLALAAYNTGEKNVDAFLNENKRLARETIDFVPSFYSRMSDYRLQ